MTTVFNCEVCQDAKHVAGQMVYSYPAARYGGRNYRIDRWNDVPCPHCVEHEPVAQVIVDGCRWPKGTYLLVIDDTRPHPDTMTLVDELWSDGISSRWISTSALRFLEAGNAIR